VLNKGKKSYTNARGEGRLFNMDVADASGEIRVTGFNDQVDQIYEVVEVGRCYRISGGQLKPVNKQYSTNNHQYEITLNRNCVVEPAEEPIGELAIPKHNFVFTKVAAMETMQEESKVDVLAVIQQLDEPVTFTAKTSGKEMTKRVAQLTDDSGRAIEATIFGTCDKPLQANAIVAIKGAKVGSWNTKSLTIWGDATISVHPDLPEAHSLMGWWTSAGMHAPPPSMSVAGGNSGGGRPAARIVFSDIEDNAMGLGQEPDYFTVRCMVTHIKTDQRSLWYVACPQCKKKVVDADDENNQLQGNCEKCGQTVTGVRRWIFSANCNDATGNKYVSFFDDTALPLLGGKTADELAPLKHAQSTEFDQHFIASSFKQYNLKCRIKSETYNSEARVKVSCNAITPVDFVVEGHSLLEEIRTMRQQAY